MVTRAELRISGIDVDRPQTPLLDTVALRRPTSASSSRTSCASSPTSCAQETIAAVGGNRRPSRRGPRRGRADRRDPLRVRHARRPADLGRRPPGLSAQDPHRPARPHPHPAPGRRPVAASPSAARANTTRSARRTARPRSRPALGFAIANKLAGTPGKAIAVIGDGAMSAGMAYEAMNNAEAAGNRLVVILNDNDMSIAPPVGGLSHYLARLVSLGQVSGACATSPSARARKLPEPLHTRRRKTEEYRARHGHRRHAVRGAGLLLCRPDRRPRSRPAGPGARECPRCRRRAVLVHVVTKKGKGYAPAEDSADKYHGVAEVRRRHRRAGQGRRRARRAITNVFAKALIAEAARDDKDRARSPRRCRRGTGLDKFARALSRPHVRRRHRRAACGDLRRRPRRAGHAPVLRDLFDLPPARLRPGGPRRRDPEPARPLRDRPRRAWSAPTARPTPAASTSPISRTLPNFVVMAAADEAELVTWSTPRRSTTAARSPSATRAATARALPLPEVPAAARDRQGPDRPRRQEGRHPLARHAARRSAQGRRPARGQGPLDHRRRPALRQAARRAS